VPQVPLFLHPFGAPPSEVEQLVHAIIYILIASKKLKLLFKCYFERKDSIFLTEFKLLIFQVFINKKTY
jgi:hypothetical protein